MQFITATEEQKNSWQHVLARALKDITEEHRSIVLNSTTQMSELRESISGDSMRKGGKVSLSQMKKKPGSRMSIIPSNSRLNSTLSGMVYLKVLITE